MQRHPLQIPHGSTLTLQFAAAAGVDMSGCTLTVAISRSRAANATPIWSASVAGGMADANAVFATIKIPASQSRTIPVGDGYWLGVVGHWAGDGEDDVWHWAPVRVDIAATLPVQGDAAGTAQPNVSCAGFVIPITLEQGGGGITLAPGSVTIAYETPGKSAYEVAVEIGFVGTEAEWLVSLEGKSAYEVAVEIGFVGTEAEWLASLDGADGISADDGPESRELALTAAVSPAVTTLDLSAYRSFFITLGAGNAILNLTSAPGAGRRRDVSLTVIQDAVGGRAITGYQLDGVSVVAKASNSTLPPLSSGPGQRTGLHLAVRPGEIVALAAGRAIG